MTMFKPADYRILIVVHSTSTLGVLFEYLIGFGFKVLVAGDGENALVMAEHVKPDIILLDMALPGIDGFETCRQLKTNPATKDVPVIIITTRSNTVDKLQGFALGAVDYITKPIQSEEVLARLKTHLTLQNLQSALTHQNTQLQREITEREKLIAELNAFAHTVAHDLKNPLGVTITYAQFLQKFHSKLQPDELEQRLEVIMRNGQKMNTIINELLLLATVRTEDFSPELLEMDEIVAEALARMEVMLTEAQTEIVIPESWPITLGYGPWVEEIWANYISNAVKYGGQPPRIELGATLTPDGLARFWVRDNGGGLTRAEQARLFIPFTRLNHRSVEGHGLGLSIVQRIVDKLGGTVSIESEGVPGLGSVFSFSLPLSQPQLHQPNKVDPSIAAP